MLSAETKANGMAVWMEDGRAGGLERFARGPGEAGAAEPLPSAFWAPGQAWLWAGPRGGVRTLQTLLALALPVLAAGVLAAQAHGLALATLGGLAVLNLLMERRVRPAARSAGLAGLAALGGLALQGLAGAALVLTLWRLAADTAGLHRGLNRMGRADGLLAGLGLWPLAAASGAFAWLVTRAPLAGISPLDLPVSAAFAWLALTLCAACVAFWLAARAASWRMREPFTRRDAYLAMLGLALPLLLAGPPDLAIGLSMTAALRLGLNLAQPKSL